MKLGTINLVWLYLCLFAGSSASAQAPTQPKSRSIKIPELWGTVEKATRSSLTKRRGFANTLHEVLGNLDAKRNQERAHVYAALAVIHGTDFLTMHASLSFVVAAQKSWPGFAQTRYALYVWNSLLQAMSRKQIVNEHLLSRVAEVFAGGLVSTQETTEYPYYRGWSLFRAGDYSNGLSMLERVPLKSPHYRRAKFLEATSLVMLERIADARETYQIVVSLEPTEFEMEARMPPRSIQRLRDLAALNVARLLYEQKRFGESLAYYRSLDQDSHFFFESLAEQGWSFFMAGYPRRALGSAYAALSPFFNDRFNPDVHLLFSTLYFWMCHYDYARQGLSQFIEHSKDEGDRLRVFLSGLSKLSALQKRDRLMKVMESAAEGLNPKSVGLGNKTVSLLASQEGLMDAYEGYSAIRDRRLRLQKLNLRRDVKARILTALEEFENELSMQASLHAEDTLLGLQDDYTHALDQARLLWLEILTAEKEDLLGRGRGSEQAQFEQQSRNFVEEVSKGKKTKWSQDKHEFWFDELDSYVFDLQSKCKSVEGSR